MSDLIPQAALELYRAFVAQGVEVVYATTCCGRLYVGVAPSKKCRTCQGIPKSVELTSEADISKIQVT